MGMQINTNIMALNAQHRLAANNMKYGKALERLSSGSRINRAADDAAGLAISEKLTAQVKGLTQASSNAQDGISLIQTGEGGLNESHAILQRMRELVVQAGTATVTANDKTNIQSEVGQLQSELDRISSTTKYNGISLLTGGFGTTATTTAALADGMSSVQSNGAKAATYTFTATAGTSSGTKLQLSDGAGNIETVDNVALPTGLNSGTVNFSKLGLTVSTNANLTATSLNGKTITTSGTTNSNILVGSSAAAGESIGVTIGDMSSAGLSVNSAAVDVTSASLTSSAMLSSIDSAIQTVSGARANLGAVQNRLEHTINSLSVAVENLSASNSRIRDTDVAQETTNMVTAQILNQAGVSVLSQANQAPQGALKLLG